MTCAKTTVRCTLVFPDGRRVVGSNWCASPQPACPRAPGEGYEKCRSICHQSGHAEEDAIHKAGGVATGARAYIEGHTYACQNCQQALFAAGVKSLTIGPPPPALQYDPGCISRVTPELMDMAMMVGQHMARNNITHLGPIKLRGED